MRKSKLLKKGKDGILFGVKLIERRMAHKIEQLARWWVIINDMNYSDIRFPNLHITIPSIPTGITIGGFEIRFYGMIIALGCILGLFLVQYLAKKDKKDPEAYLDYLLFAMIPAIFGARAYYVIFSWSYYKEHLNEILNLRLGGLAILGGVIAALIVLVLFCKARTLSFFDMTDMLVPGLLVGQIMGRWGNFFNREAFGSYTDSLFAMQIPVGFFEKMNRLGELEETGLLEHTKEIVINGVSTAYIQVHPTFLYESLWNIAILSFILYYRKRKKFRGECFAIYLAGYGVGRFFIESLRVDQLQIGNTGIAITQVVCAIMAIVAVGIILYKHLARSGR